MQSQHTLQANKALLQQILTLAYQAGEHLKTFYAGSVDVKIKSDKTPVTEADLFISQFLTEQLQQLTPNIPILSEENCAIPLDERKKWQTYWIIDPLDGTQQFIDRTDQFSIVIGLMQQNQPVLGVIHSPILDKTYYALKGQGAFLQEGETYSQLPLYKKRNENHRLKITLGISNSESIAKTVQSPYQVEFMQYGSSSLKAGLVAEGKADCYVRFGDTGEWDTAVAEILLAESGGEIFDLDFNPLRYNQRETFINPYFVMVGDKQKHWRDVFHFLNVHPHCDENKKDEH